MNDAITVETSVAAPIERVWDTFNDPDAIVVWNTASEDWHTTRAENDVRVGGSLSVRMEAKNGSAGFDLNATYTEVIPYEFLAYTLEDGRQVEVTFIPGEDSVHVVESFEPETENTHELQQGGWQAILDRFKRYCEQA